MKRLLLVLILTFSLQLGSKADDISDFEIEGISIGDSALDFYSVKQIKDNYQNWFEPKYGAATIIESSDNYDEIQLMYEFNDSNYKIVAISALKYVDPTYCLNKIDDIKVEIKNLFDENIKEKKKKTFRHSGDKSGKSKVTSIDFILKKNKASIIVACYDWSKQMKYSDNLRISVRTNKYKQYISK